VVNIKRREVVNIKRRGVVNLVGISSFENSMIINTWESTGLSNKKPQSNFVIRYARPWIMVSQQIRELFDKEKISNIEYENVIIE